MDRNNCIEWHRAKLPTGYGRQSYKGRIEYAHRAAYCNANKLTPEDIRGQVVMHKCDNPSCVNPEHLVLGTQQDNMQDMTNKKRRAKTLSDADIKYIMDNYNHYSRNVNTVTLAKELGVVNSTIGRVVKKEIERLEKLNA